MPADPVLVPVARSATLRETIEYAVSAALEAAAEGEAARLHVVSVHGPRAYGSTLDAPDIADADELLDRVAVWAEEDAGDAAIEVTTDHLGRDAYLFSPADVAATLRAEARTVGAQRVVLDPEYDPGIGAPLLRPLAAELRSAEELTVEEAPVRVRVRRVPIVRRANARRLGAVAGLSFVFYQVLGGTLSTFDLVTGAAAAVVVAASLSRVSIGRDPSLRRTPLRALRGALYVPYLLWEILKANVTVARVILDPRASIDPSTVEIEPAVYGGLPVTSLANSITLTPGTLTVRVQGNRLLVHTLLPSSRADLFAGGLERGVRFVFYGRRGLRLDPLDARGAAAILDPEAVAATGSAAPVRDAVEEAPAEAGVDPAADAPGQDSAADESSRDSAADEPGQDSAADEPGRDSAADEPGRDSTSTRDGDSPAESATVDPDVDSDADDGNGGASR